jgi:ribosomal protein L3 glutamine methyltransferase
LREAARPSSKGPGRTVAGAINSLAVRFRAARLTFGHGTHNAREEAAWLVMHACGVPLDRLEDSANRGLSSAELRRIERLAERRMRERIPAAYLTGEAWLGEFRFYVDRRVIVPRSFIAELLPDGIGPFVRKPVRTALDLCTGSGCLAVLLAHAFPHAMIDAVDLSSGALAVARRNIADYKLGRRIHPLRSDLFSALPDRRYDLIVSNPPYVNDASMRVLPDEYLVEPRMALAGGKDGLRLVRRILAESRRHLQPGGVLVCEIGHNRKALERAYPEVPFTWLETSAGNGFVFLLEREELPA